MCYILEGEQPAMGRSTSPIHDGVGPGIDGSILPFNRVLILMVWLILPITDVVGLEDVLDLVGDLNFHRITDKLVHLCILSSKVLTNCLPDLIG